MFFTWQADDAERSYVNDADIREGVRQATVACRQQGLKIPAVARRAPCDRPLRGNIPKDRYRRH